MARVYSTNFMAAHDVPSTLAYALPAGYVGVLRSVQIFVNTDPPGPANAVLLGDNGQVVVVLNELVATQALVNQSMRYVFTTGLFFSTDYAADISASGYLLSLP
jgi:hypothetical protein